MALATRVIACLDVDDGRVVKGVNFEGMSDAGDPVELARAYGEAGIDELVFLDVTASHQGRGTLIDVVERTASQVFIPLTVGGGVRSATDVSALLRAGADKVSINTAAIKNPELVTELAARFGSQCIVASVDARRTRKGEEPTESGWTVTTHGGRTATGLDAIAWAAEVAERGAGEILLNSMDADGTKAGFDAPLIAAVRKKVAVPVIASGGAGSPADLPPAVEAGADAVLMAAAVADVRPAAQAEAKLKKSAGGDALASIELQENPDIVRGLVAARKDGELPAGVRIVCFAAETGDETASAREFGARKLKAKGADLIMVNEVGEGGAFGSADNEGWLMRPDPEGDEPIVAEVPRGPKLLVAGRIVEELAGLLDGSND